MSSDRVQFKRSAEDRPRREGEVGKRSILQAFVGDQSVSAVEEENSKRLVPECPHRCYEIAAEGGIQRVDWGGIQITPHRFEKHVMRADEQERYVRIGAENAGKGFGGLRPDIADAAKLRQQR